MALTQQELEGRLWAAANSLRGPVDPSDFKAYIFPLLFYKRVTDAWDDEHARAVADFGADVSRDVEADYHRFQLPEGCHWRDLRKVHENVGVGLQNILDRIQQANPDTLAGIFGDVQWGNKDKLPEHALLNLIEAFHTLDLSPSRHPRDEHGADRRDGAPADRTIQHKQARLGLPVGLLLPNLLHGALTSARRRFVHRESGMIPDKLDPDWAAGVRAGYRPYHLHLSVADFGVPQDEASAEHASAARLERRLVPIRKRGAGAASCNNLCSNLGAA